MFLFTGRNKHELRDISLRSGFAASGWWTVVLSVTIAPLFKARNSQNVHERMDGLLDISDT